VTNNDIRRANRRSRTRRRKYPAAISAHYDASAGMVVIALENGVDLSFPPHAAQGLEGAATSDLTKVELTGRGTGIWFPTLDVDLHVQGIARGMMGTRRWIATRVGPTGAGEPT